MILEHLTIENIRSCHNVQIDFPKGITLFQGDIGSGKSTLLMAIEFALFGLGSAKGGGLLTRGEKSGGVILKFRANDKTYEVHRDLKESKKGSTTTVGQDPKGSYLKIDDEELFLSPSELKQQILKILKFNEPASPRATSKIFRYAVFTPQEEMKTILREKDIRLDTIRKAFRIEDYQIAIENAGEIIREINHRMDILKGRLYDTDQLESELNGYNDQLSKLQTDAKQIVVKKENLEEQEKNKDEILSDVREKQSEKVKKEGDEKSILSDIKNEKKLQETYEGSILSNESRVQGMEKSIKQFKEMTKPTEMPMDAIDAELKKFNKLNNEIIVKNTDSKSRKQQIAKVETKLGDLHNKDIEMLQEKLVKFNDQISINEEKLQEQQKLENGFNTKYITADNKINELEKRANEIKGLGSKCSLCGQILTAEHIKGQENERVKALEAAARDKKEAGEGVKRIKDVISDIEHEIKSDKKDGAHLEIVIPDLEDLNTQNTQLEQLQNDLVQLQSANVIPEVSTFPNGGKYKEPVEYLQALKSALFKYENADNTNTKTYKRYRKL